MRICVALKIAILMIFPLNKSISGHFKSQWILDRGSGILQAHPGTVTVPGAGAHWAQQMNIVGY